MQARMCEAVQLQLRAGVGALPSCRPYMLSGNAHSAPKTPLDVHSSLHGPGGPLLALQADGGSAAAVAAAWQICTQGSSEQSTLEMPRATWSVGVCSTLSRRFV